MTPKLQTLLEQIIQLHVPDDIFFLYPDETIVIDIRDTLKKYLEELTLELQSIQQKWLSQYSLSRKNEALLTKLVKHLLILVQDIHQCNIETYGSHNQLYGGSIAKLNQGENDGLHLFLQDPIALLENFAERYCDSEPRVLASAVHQFKQLIETYNSSLTPMARFKPKIRPHSEDTVSQNEGTEPALKNPTISTNNGKPRQTRRTWHTKKRSGGESSSKTLASAIGITQEWQRTNYKKKPLTAVEKPDPTQRTYPL